MSPRLEALLREIEGTRPTLQDRHARGQMTQQKAIPTRFLPVEVRNLCPSRVVRRPLLHRRDLAEVCAWYVFFFYAASVRSPRNLGPLADLANWILGKVCEQVVPPHSICWKGDDVDEVVLEDLLCHFQKMLILRPLNSPAILTTILANLATQFLVPSRCCSRSGTDTNICTSSRKLLLPW